MNGEKHFTTEELGSISLALQEFEENQIEFNHPAIIVHSLASLWQVGEPTRRRPAAPVRLREAMPEEAPYRALRAIPREPEWDLGLSSEFRKAVRNIDRKLQGRILQALDYITTKPTVARGDTVKPLRGEFEGLWRYRIGDYRLLYRPETDSRRVVLVTFVSRGSAYA